MSATLSADRVRRARMAVSLLFFVNGASFANVLPRLPALKDELHLTNAALGTAIAMGPVGGMITGALVGLLMARFGSAAVTVAFSFTMLLGLAVVGVAPTLLILVVAFFIGGASDAAADVGVNAHGVLVQRAYGRSILHGFHGWWSIGALTGGLIGAAAAALDVPLRWHLAAVAATLVLVVLHARRGHLGGREVDLAAHADDDAVDAVGGRPTLGGLVALLAVIAPIAVAGILGNVMEEASQTWNSIYLTEVVGVGAGLAALGYVAFTAAMTLGRLTNDRWIDRWGNVRVARTGAAIAATGLGIVALAGGLGALPLALAGFAMTGFGVSATFPIMIDAAGHRPGIRSSAGVATVSWLARLAFFASPVIIGITADAVGLRVALLLPLVAGLGAIAAAGAFARRGAMTTSG
jgi:MFS family permease